MILFTYWCIYRESDYQVCLNYNLIIICQFNYLSTESISSNLVQLSFNDSRLESLVEVHTQCALPHIEIYRLIH